MSNKQFELEQSIMHCWSVCEDLNLIAKNVLEKEFTDPDKLANILIGMADLYQLKFEDCFENFEETLKYYHNLLNTYRSTDREETNKLTEYIETRHAEY